MPMDHYRAAMDHYRAALAPILQSIDHIRGQSPPGKPPCALWDWKSLSLLVSRKQISSLFHKKTLVVNHFCSWRYVKKIVFTGEANSQLYLFCVCHPDIHFNQTFCSDCLTHKKRNNLLQMLIFRSHCYKIHSTDLNFCYALCFPIRFVND